jgi:tRNA A37 methylthiotransferase MiaB
MQQLPNKIIKQRSVEASLFVRKLQFQKNIKDVGKVFKVLITEENNEIKGRNQNYKQIVIKNAKKIEESWVNVKVFSTTSTSLIGKIEINNN